MAFSVLLAVSASSGSRPLAVRLRGPVTREWGVHQPQHTTRIVPWASALPRGLRGSPYRCPVTSLRILARSNLKDSMSVLIAHPPPCTEQQIRSGARGDTFHGAWQVQTGPPLRRRRTGRRG